MQMKLPDQKREPPPQHLTTRETEALFRAITDPRDRAIFQVAYHRGLRASEVGRLDLADYRAVHGRLFVHRLKGSISNEYLLTAAEQTALRAWLRVRGLVPGPLFPYPYWQHHDLRATYRARVENQKAGGPGKNC